MKVFMIGIASVAFGAYLIRPVIMTNEPAAAMLAGLGLFFIVAGIGAFRKLYQDYRKR